MKTKLIYILIFAFAANLFAQSDIRYLYLRSASDGTSPEEAFAGVSTTWLDDVSAWSNQDNIESSTDDTYGTTVKVSSDGSQAFKFILPSSVNLQTHGITFKIKQLDAELSGVALKVAQGSTTISPLSWPSISGIMQYSQGEWFKASIAGGIYMSDASTVGPRDDVQAVELVVSTATSTEVLISDFRIHENIKPAGVVFVFDDGRPGVYDNAFPLFESRGYDGVVPVSSFYTDSPSNGVSVPNLIEMQNAGWEMVNHTYRNDTLTDLYASDPATSLASVIDGENWMVTNGMNAASAKILVLPGGKSNTAVRDQLEPVTDAIFAHTGTVPINPYVYDPRNIYRTQVFSHHNVATNFAFRLDSIAENGGVHILMLHDVVATEEDKTDLTYDVTVGFLSDFFDAIEARDLEVYLLKDIL